MSINKEADNLLMIKVTNRCNNKCIFCCDRKPGESLHDLSLDLIEKYLKKGVVYDKIHIIGGEPTLYPKMIQLLEMLNKMGYNDIFLETNAINLSQYLVKCFINKHVNTFIVGLHSVSNEIYYELTGNKGLEKCRNNIQQIVNNGGKVKLNIAVQTKNYTSIDKIVDQMHLIGVNDFILCSVIPPLFQHYSFKEIVPSYTEIYPYLLNLLKSRDNININLQYFPYCIIKGIEKYRLKGKEGSIHYLDIDGNAASLKIDWTTAICIKNETCNHCIYTKQCNGVFKEYINHFGWNEFKPVLN